MNKAFEKILEKFDAKKQYFQKFYEADGKTEEDEYINKATQLAFDDAKNIVQEVAEEYNNGWIACSERLPEEPEEGLTDLDECDEYIAMIENADIPTALNYAGNGEWYRDGEFYKVIAWQPLPEPYKETIERTGEIQ